MKDYLNQHGMKILMLLVLFVASVMGIMDPAAATMGGMVVLDTEPATIKELAAAVKKAMDEYGVNLRKTQDIADNALAECKKLGGTIESKTADALKEAGENGKKLGDQLKELQDRLLEVEQKGARRPGGGDAPKSMFQLISDSEEFKACLKQGDNAKNMDAIKIGSFHKAPILNATLNNDQPLVAAQRLPGIIVEPNQPLTMRSLIPSGRATSNYIEYAKENVFTNSAAPQGSGSSPTETEGQAKAESGITFTLTGAAVITLAHWIPASRQVLQDAAMLSSYVEGRLIYGLKQEEDDEILNGTGTNGTLNGLVNNATAYNRGASSDTQLDTLLKALLQVSLSYYDASGFVLNPIDWTNIMLLKDTQGRYLFGDPQGTTAPRVWGKTVLPTTQLAAGKFMAGAFNLAAQIWDKEDASVRVAEQHSDFFVKNMVAILAEERLALTIYRPLSFVYGNISHTA